MIQGDEPTLSRPLIRPRPEQPRALEPTEYCGVYFVRWGEYVKIGTAHNVVTRRRAIEVSFPFGDVEPLGWIQADSTELAGNRFGLERLWHKAAGRLHVRGEWFRDCPELRALITKYAKPWPTT
jgi:hypothetical protein